MRTIKGSSCAARSFGTRPRARAIRRRGQLAFANESGPAGHSRNILVFQKRHSNESPRKSGRRRSHATIFWSSPAAFGRFGPESAKRGRHPAPFPVELPRRLIELYTFGGDIVLDPFMGAGATAIAATELGRRYVGYETDDGYADRAEQRHQRVEGRPRGSNVEAAESHLAVVSNLYRDEFKNGINNQSLSRYFDKAFQSVIDQHSLYPAWACINCLRHDVSTVRWGPEPSKWPECGDSAAYSVATFQGRASRLAGFSLWPCNTSSTPITGSS